MALNARAAEFFSSSSTLIGTKYTRGIKIEMENHIKTNETKIDEEKNDTTNKLLCGLNIDGNITESKTMIN